MLTTKTTRNPNALAQLEALAKEVVLKMADVGAEQLRDNLSAGPRTGEQYPDLPRRSSAPKEFSQEQSGRLKGMVKSDKTDNGAYFGLVPEDEDEREQALEQEFGAPQKNLAGRANVRRTAYDPRTQNKMRQVKP